MLCVSRKEVPMQLEQSNRKEGQKVVRPCGSVGHWKRLWLSEGEGRFKAEAQSRTGPFSVLK